ncbi:S-layer homology domain-containing protein [Pseudoneobacillus sp. C159]
MAYQPKSYRKFLTGTISAAVVASAIAPVASAAEVKFTDLAGQDQETLDAITALVGLNVIQGYQDGTFKPNQTITRGQAAEMTVKALKLTPKATPAGNVFEDLTAKSYYSPYAEALVDAKVIPAGGKFAAATPMTRGDMALALVAGFGLKDNGKAVEVKDIADLSAEAQAAIKILAQHELTKLQDGNFNPKDAVKRSQFALFFNRTVTLVAQAQGELKVEAAKAVDVNKIEVKYNKALPTDAVVELKKGLVPYNTKATYSEDRKTVTLESSFNLPAGEYQVTTTGVKDAAKVEVKAETATTLTIDSTGVEKKDGAALNITLANQYGKKMTLNRADFTITAFNATKGEAVSVAADKFTLDLAKAAKDDKVVIAIAYKTGLNVSATLPVINEVASATFAFGEVVLPKDQVRIYDGDKNVQIKYNLLDQYGKEIKLTADQTTKKLVDGKEVVVPTISGVTFVSTNSKVLDVANITTDKEGNLLFVAGEKGTATLTALVAATGSTSQITIEVANKASVNTFKIAAPASLVVADEDVVIPFEAVDQFGGQILGKDITNTERKNITFASSNDTIVSNSDFRWNSKNELVLKAKKAGSVTVYVYANNVLQNSISLTIQEKAVATRITGVKNLPLLFEASTNAKANFSFSNLTVVDQYNRAYTLDGETIVVEAKDKKADVITLNTDKNSVELKTGETASFAGTATAGSEDFIVSIKGVTGSAHTISMGTVKTADITTYELTAPAAIKVDADPKYVGTLKLVGKTSNGSSVNLATGKVTHSTTSNDVVAESNGLKVTGKKAGTAVIGVWNGATKLAEVTVTVSEAAAVPTTVSFDADASYTVKVGEKLNLAAALEVLDQYGVDITAPKTGFWTTTDKEKATVVTGNEADAGTVTGVAAGDVTIGYVTSNGLVVTVKVTVTAAPVAP